MREAQELLTACRLLLSDGCYLDDHVSLSGTKPHALASILANPEHLAKLRKGVETWNRWREQNPEIRPDLYSADLARTDLRGAHLNGAQLARANLGGSNLAKTNLTGAMLLGAVLSTVDFREANLSRAHLQRADLSGAQLNFADLSGASLDWSNLRRSDFSGAKLSGANLTGTTMVSTNLEGANLTACRVYGISAWNVRLEGTIQSNLEITPFDESPIQVDNFEVAQFISLLLNSQNVRHVVDTLTSKVVLILGRFKAERTMVADAIRDELRKRDYLPILFNITLPKSNGLARKISMLANMARFVIADLTGPSSVPLELAALVPNVVVPVQTIVLEGQREYAMFPDLMRRHHWVLAPHQYKSQELLISHLGETVIAPAEAKAKELAQK